MKVKVKLDFASIKSWFFEHGEKLAFGVMALVFLMFAYSATQREVLDATKQPEKLLAVAQQVNEKVEKSPWDEKIAGIAIVDYTARAKREEVPLAAFAANVPLSGPLIDPMGKRADPPIYNVEEVQVRGGFGCFAISSSAKGDKKSGAQGAGHSKPGEGIRPSPESTLRAQPWAVITALVPVSKQAAEFDRVFSRAMGASSDHDRLRYLGAVVERAEVNPANPADLKWQPVESDLEFQKQWDARGDEVVAIGFVDAQLTSPLGPLVDRGWDAAVAHPKIPTRADSELQEAARQSSSEQTKTAQTQPGANPPPAAQGGPKSTADYRLLRVFDYQVSPRKSYRYRVKLKVANPNFKVDPRFLVQPDAPTNAEEFRTADSWAESTDAATIPSGFGILAGSVDPKSTEPVANLLLTAIDPKEGIPASTMARIYRGNVANKRESKVSALDPRTQKSVVIDHVDFNTGMVVVDIYGGEYVSLRTRRDDPLAAPGEVLLLDPDGRLIVRSDIDDLAAFTTRKPPEEEPPPRKRSSDDDDSKKKKSAPKNSGKAATSKAATSKASTRAGR